VISGEATHTNFIVFGFTNPRSTLGKHANHWNQLLFYHNKMKTKNTTLSEQFQKSMDKS